MKKILASVSVLVAALVFSGCGGQKAAQQTAIQKGVPVEVKNEKVGGVINSIKDAMALGKRIKCSYFIGDEKDYKKIDYSVYVEGQKYKSTMTLMGKSSKKLFDGETLYAWTERTGTKTNLACMKNLKTLLPQDKDGDEIMKALQIDPNKFFEGATHINCSLDQNVDFSVPADINFYDMCEAWKQSILKNTKPSVSTQIPASTSKF